MFFVSFKKKTEIKGEKSQSSTKQNSIGRALLKKKTTVEAIGDFMVLCTNKRELLRETEF